MTAHFHDIPAKAADITAVEKQPTQSQYRRWVKRFLDVSIVLVTAPFTVPLVALMAVFVSLDRHGPFYSQVRIGRGGREFKMVKLRTMVPHADEMLARYLYENPGAKIEWDTTQKLKNDPRITSTGRILRKSSLDELPQLWNVLLGHMSLVGPRPMLPAQRDLYPGTEYFTVRPGITGPWQVSARNSCEFKGRARYDALYASTVSFRTDAALIVRTIKTVLRGTGY